MKRTLQFLLGLVMWAVPITAQVRLSTLPRITSTNGLADSSLILCNDSTNTRTSACTFFSFQKRLAFRQYDSLNTRRIRIDTVKNAPVFLLGFTVPSPLSISGAAGTQRGVKLQTSGVDRWFVYAGSTAEAGANAGSSFNIEARTDAGAVIDSPISILRAAGGAMTVSRPTTMSSTLNVAQLITASNGVAVTGGLTTTGDLNVGSGKFVAIAASGNTTVVGTLGVTGVLTGSSSVFAGAAAGLGFTARGHFLAQSDGVWTLLNNAETDFTRLQLGGTTASFPAIKRSSATIAFRLADDSGDSNISAASGVFSSSVTVAAGSSYIFSGRGGLTGQADGVFTFANSAGTSFSRLQLGGTTSSFPALKRNGATLESRLADDAGYAGFAALNLVASARVISGTDPSSAVAPGTFSDGTALASGDASVTRVLGGLVTVATSDGSNGSDAFHVSGKQTAATSSNIKGVSSAVEISHTSGTVSLGVPVLAAAFVLGNGGTTTTLDVFRTGGNIGTGATVTTWRGLHVAQPTKSGTLTTLTGIEVDNMTTGGTTNNAIKTNGGNVTFTLPTSAAGLPNCTIWNNAGVVNITTCP